MMQAHVTRSRRAPTSSWPSSRPTAATRCCSTRARRGRPSIPFVFDPGQGLPMFDGEELREFIDQASWVTVNDYEAQDAAASAPAGTAPSVSRAREGRWS